MKRIVPIDQYAASRPVLLALGVLFAIILILGVTRFGTAAEQVDGRPTPEVPQLPEKSPYVGVISTTQELLDQEPSIERYLGAHTISADQLLGANLEPSQKTVSPDKTPAGGLIIFTIVVSNTGDTDALVTMIDKLPGKVQYEEHECSALITTSCEESNGTVTWKGTAIAGQDAVITIKAQVKANVEPGTVIENKATIKSDGGSIVRKASFEVSSLSTSPIQFLPYTSFGLRPDPMPITLSAGSPNSHNEWTMSWTDSPGATHFELQESKSADFVGASTYNVTATEQPIVQFPSPSNVYYYRARSMVGGHAGPWSNIEQVIGGYYDDFDDASSGWPSGHNLQRTTYLEEVRAEYETQDSWYFIQSDDRWDWGIASPGKPAPRVPYVIEYEVEPANLANLLSFGFAFGADWSNDKCPSDPDSFDGLYKHNDCFNHFYNPNIIFDANLKLLWERVDRLEWCLDCGGSPMKRLGDIDGSKTKRLKDVDSEGWNKYRIEVRQDGIKFFAGKRGGELKEQYFYADTRWIGDPYFGVFASTDEYSNSTWRYDYVSVMPLDE